jgi:hypothetical protein
VWVAVVGSDGDDEPAVEWKKVGKPAGTTIVPVGADSGGLESPYLFARTSGGDLWVGTEGATGWTWTKHGRPAGVWIQGSYGVVAPQYGGQPYAFVRGSDGNMWTRSWNGSAWTWRNLGQPPTTGTKGIASAGGAVMVQQTRPTVFVKGNDGDLWLVELRNNTWKWARQGRPGVDIKATYGATALNYTTPAAAVLDVNGDLWRRTWNGTSGTWTKIYPGANALFPAGVTSGATGGDFWAHFRNTRGEVWRSEYPPGGGRSAANPRGIGFDAPFGSVNFGYTEVLENMTFLKGTDSHLWILWSVTGRGDLRWIDGGFPVATR